jgi:hypothetical protein
MTTQLKNTRPVTPAATNRKPSEPLPLLDTAPDFLLTVELVLALALILLLVRLGLPSFRDLSQVRQQLGSPYSIQHVRSAKTVPNINII